MTADEGLALLGLAAFALGALVTWYTVEIWLRPVWESNAWWRSAPASVRDRITAQRAAAEQLEAELARRQLEPSGPDDITTVFDGLPHVPAHEPHKEGE